MIGTDSFRQEGSELSTEGPKGTPPTPDCITSSENTNTQEEGPYGVSYLSPKHPNITNRKWPSKWRRDASRGSGVGCADLWLGHDPNHNDPLRSGSPGSRSPKSGSPGSRTIESGSPRMVSLSFNTSELPVCCTNTQREHSHQQRISVEGDPWGRDLGRSDPCHDPDPVTHDPDPVSHDPDPVSHGPDPETHKPDTACHDPDPVTHDPDPVCHDPDPETHDPDPACHGCDPVYHDPDPAGRDPQQYNDLEDRRHSEERDACNSVDSPHFDLAVKGHSDLSSLHTTNNISDDVSVLDELASTLSDLHIWSGPETSPVIPLSEMCPQRDDNSTCKERSLPAVFMLKPESLKTVPIFSVNSSNVVPFAQSALTRKVNMASGIEAAPENYSVLSPKSHTLFGNCVTDTSELNQKREDIDHVASHIQNQMKNTFWEMDVTDGAGLTELTLNIAAISPMETTPTLMEATPTQMEATPTEMETTPTDIEVTPTDNSFYTETLPSEGLPCCSGFRNAAPLTETLTTLTSHATQSSTQLISDYDESFGPDPPLQTQICTRSKTRGLRQKVAGETNDDQNDDNQEIRVVLVDSDVTKGTYIGDGWDNDETVSDEEWQRCCMRRVRSPDKPQIANIGAASGHGASAEENLTQRQESQRSHGASSSRRTTRALLAEARRTLRPRPVSPQGTYRHMVGETADALQTAVHLRRTSLAHRRSDVDQVIASQKQTLESVLDRRSTMAGGQLDGIREGGQGYGEQVPYWVFVLTLVVTLPCLFYWILFL